MKKILLKLFYIFYIINYTYSGSEFPAEFVIDKLDGFSEILIVLDSLEDYARTVETFKASTTNQLAVFDSGIDLGNKNVQLQAIFNFVNSAEKNSFVIVAPSNFSTLSLTLDQISFFYRSSSQMCDLFKPFFIIISTEEVANRILEIRNISHAREFPLDSNIFFVFIKATQSNSHTNPPTILEVYSIGENVILQELNSSSYLINEFVQWGVRRKDFHQHVISCTAQTDPNYTLESESKIINGTWVLVGGLSVEIFRDLEFSLNFKSKSIQGDGWMERDNKTGKWIGMAGQVLSGEVDISISQSIILPERFSSFTFLHSTHFVKVYAYFRQPRSSSLRNIYRHAFDYRFWMTDLLFWIIAAAVVKIVFKISELFSGKYYSSPISTCDEELSENSVLWVVGTQCQQGWHHDPKSGSMKIIFISCSLCALIFYIAFSGSLVSILSTEEKPIQSLDDLLLGQFELLTDFYIPFIPDVLRHAIETSKQSILSKQNLASKPVESEEAIKSIMSQPCAFLTVTDGFMTIFRQRFNSTDNDVLFCKSLSSVRVTQQPMPTGMFIRKGSPYKEIFNQKIVLTIERGLNFRYRSRMVLGTTAQCIPDSVHYREGLDLEDVYSAFVVVIVGYGICIICLAFEHIGSRILTREKYYSVSNRYGS